VPIEEFDRMRRYGKDLFKGVIFIGPRTFPPLLDIDGRDILQNC